MKFRRKGVFFAGALQIDRYGNSNLIGIGADYKKPKFRGPGAIGVCNATVMNSRFHLVVNSHDPAHLRAASAISSRRTAGAAAARTRAPSSGLPGGGPRYVVTPLCVMDFEDETKRMRLKSVHPGVSVDQVVKNTGFELIVPSDVPETEPPTAEQVERAAHAHRRARVRCVDIEKKRLIRGV